VILGEDLSKVTFADNPPNVSDRVQLWGPEASLADGSEGMNSRIVIDVTIEQHRAGDNSNWIRG